MLGGRGSIAPSIVNAKRKVERERIKDGLRAWLDRKANTVAARSEKTTNEDTSMSVRGLVRRFTARRKADTQDNGSNAKSGDKKWNPAYSKKQREAPTRAHVYSLRRFWEGLAMGQEVHV